ncbi:MAG: hypothetical protein ACLGH6_14580, partial [Gammaproteobacteria bacterium]
TRFELTSPADDGTIRDNTGAITVSFAIEPELKTELGHRLVVLLDGQPQAPVQAASVTLDNVDRGAHSLQGRIVDANGKVVISTPSIQVHLHRQSVQMPLRKPSPPPPAKKTAP